MPFGFNLLSAMIDGNSFEIANTKPMHTKNWYWQYSVNIGLGSMLLLEFGLGLELALVCVV